MTPADPSIVRFRQIVADALAHLESRRQEINDLNVFPVADGDTGDNMALTLRSVVGELDAAIESGVSADGPGRTALVQRLARAALLGARGNSGVILSQLIRGAAEELVARPGELISAPLVAAAIAAASRRGYDSVRQPVEGTILTVVREMAGAAAHRVALLDPAQLAAPAGDAEQNAALALVLAEAIAAGQRALDEGPELLPALKEAGVVDAGGFGLLIFFAGVIRSVGAGTPAEEFDIRTYAAARLEGIEHQSETFRYCTNFAVTGRGLDAGRARRELAELGDSIIVVVGDEETLKVHVHTDEPQAAMALFGDADVTRVDVADMHEQVAANAAKVAARSAGAVAAAAAAEPAARTRSALVAVVAGDGVAAGFAALGARLVDGGTTMNPSTADLVRAVDEAPADEVVLLPNNPNVRMAAERAAELAEKPVAVVPTRSLQAGLAIAVEHAPDDDAATNAARLQELLDELATGGVAPSARKDPAGRFDVGDALGYVGDELVAWGAPQATLRTVLSRVGAGRELVTVLTAAETPLADDAVSALAPADVELEVIPGGQPAWWWLVAAE
ncbi:DAK2 domain-containing protein [Patulibacter sp. SYSU D01012]|uniref:DAK2 domain-containing protein n=1 Tax=Patulibacter sp. SYSU D01012 TaxID=2817381 RepID=UPI001B303A44|nr:DAK2 domain-containing protein [Patulibacter sp. SYSU D01012]